MSTEEGTEQVDCVVVGAGVVGLAVARALALKGREVIIAEAEDAFGTQTSARNSEVLHAGIYYPTGSMKAQACVRGNALLYDYCAQRDIPHEKTGKLIVANGDEEEARLKALQAKAADNGVALEWLDGATAMAMEPALRCTAAVLSPTTGIVDSHALMLSLLGEAEDHGAILAVQSPVTGGSVTDDGVTLNIGGAEPMTLSARTVVNCAGHGAQALSTGLSGFPATHIPPYHRAKGNYFALSGKAPFQRLVYPIPEAAGLGVHYTRDLGGQARFGPDVEWLSDDGPFDWDVAPERGDSFYAAIRRYWPDLADDALRPDFAGLRPKIQGPEEAAVDFVLSGPKDHGVNGYVALYGIESPGLTACLALAEMVSDRIE